MSFLCQHVIREAVLMLPASHIGVGISKLEVGSQWRHNKRHFSFIFLRRVLVVVQASCSGVLISSRSLSDEPFVSHEGFADIYVPGERIFLLSLFQTMQLT